MDNMIIVWLIIGMLFLIAELGSPGFFFFFSFFLAALITASFSFFVSSIMYQLFIFLGSIILAFLMIHVWIRKHVVHRSKKQETNIDSLKGKQAVVVKAIDSNKPGYVSIYGVLWLARSADKSCIPQDSWVEIVDVQGAHVLVIKKSI